MCPAGTKTCAPKTRVKEKNKGVSDPPFLHLKTFSDSESWYLLYKQIRSLSWACQSLSQGQFPEGVGTLRASGGLRQLLVGEIDDAWTGGLGTHSVRSGLTGLSRVSARREGWWTGPPVTPCLRAELPEVQESLFGFQPSGHSGTSVCPGEGRACRSAPWQPSVRECVGLHCAPARGFTHVSGGLPLVLGQTTSCRDQVPPRSHEPCWGGL